MHNDPMDTDWFKARKKVAKTTDVKIGQAIGRDRSIVNKIISGAVKLDLAFVDGFAKELKVSKEEILARAGVLDSIEDQDNDLIDTIFSERLLAPAVWELVQNGRDARSALDLKPLVSAFSRYLRQVARRPAIHDNPDALEAIAQSIIPPSGEARTPA